MLKLLQTKAFLEHINIILFQKRAFKRNGEIFKNNFLFSRVIDLANHVLIQKMTTNFKLKILRKIKAAQIAIKTSCLLLTHLISFSP